MTRLQPPSLSLIVEQQSSDMIIAVDSYLFKLQQDDAAQARFLNMLSFLEHIGSRKIMMSQMRGSLGLEVLKHLAEETRHAFFFKRQAERFAKRELFYNANDATAIAAAGMYFGRLDAACAAAVKPEWGRDAGYYLVSLIIELRAGWLYHRYQDMLQKSEASFSLKSLIAEEAQHLREMTEEVEKLTDDDQSVMLDLIDVEDRLFRKLWNAIEAYQVAAALAA